MQLTPFATRLLEAMRTDAGWLDCDRLIPLAFPTAATPKEPPRDHRERAVAAGLEELFVLGATAKVMRGVVPWFAALPLKTLPPPRVGLVEHGWVRVRGRHLSDATQIRLADEAPVALLRVGALLLCLNTSEVMTVVGGFDGRDKLVVVERRTGYLLFRDGGDRIVPWPPEAVARGFENLDWLHVVAEAKA